MEIEIHKYKESWAKDQIAKLKQIKMNRNNKNVLSSLKNLKKSIKLNKNIIANLVECCENYATIGEMTSIMKEVFGTWTEPSFL